MPGDYFLDTLEQAGLIRRIRGTEDRRRVDVELTDEGHARWMAAMRIQDAAERGMVAELTVGEQEELNALLKKMLVLAEEGAA
jgi:DNA-binding MarR family transcriptional regulator